MTINSTSKPLAVNTPQSLAANSGNAVIVKPALEIRIFDQRSSLSPYIGKIAMNQKAKKMSKAKDLCLNISLLAGSQNFCRSPRTSGEKIQIIEKFPFMLSLSKHS